MTALGPELQRQVRELCKKHGVATLFLVGSAATGDFDPARSDFDFLVEFEPQEPGASFDAYFGLLHDLETLLGRHVDLIERSAVTNTFVRRDLERTKVPLYAAA